MKSDFNLLRIDSAIGFCVLNGVVQLIDEVKELLGAFV
jgi:hypothetical protein